MDVELIPSALRSTTTVGSVVTEKRDMVTLWFLDQKFTNLWQWCVGSSLQLLLGSLS